MNEEKMRELIFDGFNAMLASIQDDLEIAGHGEADGGFAAVWFSEHPNDGVPEEISELMESYIQAEIRHRDIWDESSWQPMKYLVL